MAQTTQKGIPMATKSLRNDHLAIAHNHLDLSAQELGACADTLYETLTTLEEELQESELKDRVLHALAALQMQDIITQRLRKVQDFLALLDNEVTLPADEAYLEEFAWENEVNQDDIDAMFSEYKG